jgi:putative Ca2+/H+ antiporter (TMEM165/GDT1 family)
MSVTLFGTAFLAVLFAELIGDKLLYGTSALVARFGAWSVVAGALPALALKSLTAVALGGVIAGLPQPVITVTSVFAFAITGYSIWRSTTTDRPSESMAESAARGFHPRGALTAFATIFFAEWGDPGQLAAAALSARAHAPGTIWLATTAALTVKLVFALSLGTVLHRYTSQRFIRWAGASLGALLAFAAAAGMR